MSAKLSIITITYQAEKYLERTIQSILEQGNRSEIEYVVVDGASTDGTGALIERYRADIDQLISEKDRGIYDAMNKGLQIANGEYVLFLNAGDTFAATNTLENILHALALNPDVVAGDAMFVDMEGNEIGLRSVVTPHRIPTKLTWKSFRSGMVICHQSFIVKRDIAPRFNVEYQLSSDIDWEIKCLKLSHKITQLPEPICRYLMGGASVQNLKKSWKERFHVMKSHFGFIETLLAHGWIMLRGISFAVKNGGKYW
jgi:glycosyltransferase involved in cell wall biosynthesis